MTEFVAIDDAVEVNGQTVLSVVDGMGSFRRKALEILEQCGIRFPQADKWYRQQDWLDAFKVIGEKVGTSTLHSIGKKIPENAIFPPEINDIFSALASIDVAYHMNHRLGEHILFNAKTGQILEGIGHYSYKKVSDVQVSITCPNPYPCDFDRGIIQAVATRFRPEGAIVTVVHDDEAPCRKNGGESCTYNVVW